MAVSTSSFTQVSNWFATTTPKTVTGVAWSSGDVIVVCGGSENGNNTLATPTNANLTFSLQASITTGAGLESPAWLWTAVAGSAQSSQTISVSRSAGSSNFGFGVWVLTGCSGSFANASANRTESGFTFTPTAGSGVVYYFADWNANATNQTLATGTGTGTERVDNTDSSTYANYAGEWVNVTATSTTFGVSSYSGLQIGHVVIEVLASGGGGVTGTVAETQDNQTSSASGQLGYSGTSARTQTNQTSAASGWITVTGTSARTQANQTSTATGQLGYSGTSARTQANQTSTASGTSAAPGVSGSVAETQDNQTSTVVGVLGYAGASARTQANQTSTASGTFAAAGFSGSAAVTQANQTSTAAGKLGYSGTSSRTQANQTSSASGTVPIAGTVARTQANQTSNASGYSGAVVVTLRVLPLYSTRTFGADGYRTGENQTVWVPTVLENGAPLLVVCHGGLGSAAFYPTDPAWYRPLEELANTGMVVIAGDLGEFVDGWGNDVSVAAVDDVIAWGGIEFGCRTDRVHFLADSAGGATAFNWARANSDRVGGLAVRAGVCDIESIYQGGAGDPGLVGLIDAAYAVGGGWPAQRATHDPALNTGELVPIADRIRCYYSPADATVPSPPTLDFVADVGCVAVPVGVMGHVDVAAGIHNGDLGDWYWSLI